MSEFPVETVRIADLKPHPRNYRQHPEDQLEHLIESIQRFGMYRNIVVARDATILAGHGVVMACRKMGIERVPVVRLDLDPSHPQALKVLVGDNEIEHLGEVDDRLLTKLLKEVRSSEELLGTGYDDMMLANLLLVTRPQSEIKDFNAAAEWVGLPSYDESNETLKLIVSFRNEADRAQFARILGLTLAPQQKSTWWPFKEKDDIKSVRFQVTDQKRVTDG